MAVRDTVLVENKKKPAVVAVTQEFVEHGKNIANIEGHAKLRQLVFPYPLEGLHQEAIRRIAIEMYPKFLQAINAQS
jgi:hypothetical protein